MPIKKKLKNEISVIKELLKLKNNGLNKKSRLMVNEYVLFFVNLKNKFSVIHNVINDKNKIEIRRIVNEKPKILEKIKPHNT